MILGQRVYFQENVQVNFRLGS